MRSFFSIVLLIVISYSSYAQEQQLRPCDDNQIHRELVTLNQTFDAQGFKPHQFNTLSIPADAYVPIMVSMKQGNMYQINFLVHPDYQKYSLVLIDQDKKELIKYKVKSKNSDGHYTSQSFVAPYTGNYWVILAQKVKGQKSSCAGFSVLESGK